MGGVPIRGLQWAFNTREISATDDDTRLYCYWSPIEGWQYGLLPPAIPWPKHQIKLYMMFSSLHDTNIILKDGVNLIAGFLGPQANAMVEAFSEVQGPTKPGIYRDWPTGIVVDTGVCFQLPLGAHAVTDQWYNTILYEDLGAVR